MWRLGCRACVSVPRGPRALAAPPVRRRLRVQIGMSQWAVGVPPVGAPPVGAPLPEAPAPFGVGSRTRGRSLPSTLASVGIPTYPWALAPELAPSSRGRSHRRAFLSLAFDTWAL